MRPSWLCSLIPGVLFAISCNPVTASPHAIIARQDTSLATRSPTSGSNIPPSATSAKDDAASTIPSRKAATTSASAASATEGEDKVSMSSALRTGSSATSSTAELEPTVTQMANETTNGTSTTIPEIDGLPIHPEITPALAVTGALFIVTGAFYTVIGIKTKWLHIFLSTAYLFSLAVTVLIVYVMHPPVSNAIQGAYFVAAAVTGIIFGALAVVFADVTEGLGCFLGGFCLGMWFLTLRAGGTITSSAGKAIFIACFTVGTFSLYISHFTRPYGLLGSTSFAGATVVLLGVDMFSRAGLKEFWLYIWGLNDDIFPFQYEGPYPMTRGIRVEVACIVLLFLLGIMSQMKVWKIIKKRREDRAAEQMRQDREQDATEEQLGRRLNAGNEKDLKMWDKIYGNKKSRQASRTDSGVGTDQMSTRKTSCTVVNEGESQEEGMEMQNLHFTNSSGKGRVTVHVAQDDDISDGPSPSGARSIRSKAATSREPSIHESQAGGAKSIASETSSIQTPAAAKTSTQRYIDPSLTLKPKYVPLPFMVPTDAKSTHDDDKSSIATFANSELPADRRSHRLSGSSMMWRLSGRSNRRSMGPTTSEEALIIPHQERSRASSMAATLDGVSIHHLSQDALSLGPLSRALSEEKRGDQLPISEDLAAAPDVDGSKQDNVVKDKARHSNSLNVLDHDGLNGAGLQRDAIPEMPEQRVSHAALTGNLPDSSSKVVMAYRTNEWAKHLDNAELPQVEDINTTRVKASERSQSPLPAPVDVQALQQTALSAEPVPLRSPSSKRDDKAQLPSSTSNNPSASKTDLTPNPMGRTPSQTSLSSNGSNPDQAGQTLPRARTSQSSLAPPSRGFRSSSTPMIGSPLASPINEDEEAFFPARFTPSPMHLMSQRDTLLRNKPSSTSLIAGSRPGSALRRSISANSTQLALDTAEDNIPLSKRKSLLSQLNSNQSPPHSSQPVTRNSSRLSLAQVAPSTPRETPKAVATWRASLADDATHQNLATAAEIDGRRADLLAEKNRQKNNVQQAQQARTQRTSVLDREMRRGSMLDAHREAMRKMQGEVKL